MGQVDLTPRWYKMDVAGRIYPAARTRKWHCTYRLAFIMRREVEPDLLRQAMHEMYARFPSFFVSLRSGLFWYHLKRMPEMNLVQPEEDFPARQQYAFSKKKPPLRIFYYKRRIAMECAHCIADGGAAMEFLKALTMRYLELQGEAIADEGKVINLHEAPQPREWEDAYKKYYTKEKLPSVKEHRSYQYRERPLNNYLKVLTGRIPLEDIKAAAKAHEMTITEYLVGAYLYAFYETAPRPLRLPLCVSVPLSLRTRYATDTLRNFSLYTNVSFDPRGKETVCFTDILEAIRGKIKQGTSRDVLQRILNQNTALAASPFIKVVPNVLKRPIMRIAFRLTGQEVFTGTLSNMGQPDLPASMWEHIETVEAVMSEMPSKHLLCAVISDNRCLNIIFTSDQEHTQVQKSMFRLLAQEGVRIRVESNTQFEGGNEHAV